MSSIKIITPRQLREGRAKGVRSTSNMFGKTAAGNTGQTYIAPVTVDYRLQADGSSRRFLADGSSFRILL